MRKIKTLFHNLIYLSKYKLDQPTVLVKDIKRVEVKDRLKR